MPSFPAIILAAGQGRRLGRLTRLRPKCLLRVGPRSLLDHQWAALAANGIDEVVVVAGYASEVVRARLKARATLIVNERHAETNSLYSLWLARDTARQGFVLLNADVLFDPEILRRVLASPHPEALAVERRRAFQAEEMKVELAGERIRALSKTLAASRAHAENVGVLKFSAAGARVLFAAMERLMADSGEKQFCPYAFNAIAPRHPLYAVPIEGLPWIEIDFADDFERARRDVWPAIEARQQAASPVRARRIRAAAGNRSLGAGN